jgi:septum site-determining protein MinC
VLVPEPPIPDWLAELDSWIGRSPGFFATKPVVLDLSASQLTKAALAVLVNELQQRAIRIIGVENADPSSLGLGLPPLLSGGRSINICEAAAGADSPTQQPPPPPPEPTFLLHEGPVRSGQSLYFPSGDVTVVGSVASGAEIVAGGSIHIYGALRGRAIAGSNGNSQARIFCSKIEAELIAIDGFYRTAEGIEPHVRGRPIQAWLAGDAVMIAVRD